MYNFGYLTSGKGLLTGIKALTKIINDKEQLTLKPGISKISKTEKKNLNYFVFCLLAIY